MDLSKYARCLNSFHDKTVHLFVKEPVPSNYIGTTYKWQLKEELTCSILPVTDKMTIELYGPRTENMLLLHTAPDAPIENGMGVALFAGVAEPSHKVVTVKKRMTHTYVLAEAVNSGN